MHAVGPALAVGKYVPARTTATFQTPWAPGGDPLDALVILEDGTFSGCRIEVRVIGVFWVKIADHTESKIVGVPANDPVWVSPRSSTICRGI